MVLTTISLIASNIASGSPPYLWSSLSIAYNDLLWPLSSSSSSDSSLSSSLSLWHQLAPPLFYWKAELSLLIE